MKKMVILMIAMFVMSFFSIASAHDNYQCSNQNYQMLYRGDPPPEGPPPQDPPPRHRDKHKRHPAPPPEDQYPEDHHPAPHEPAPGW